jgi:hypothetical protein
MDPRSKQDDSTPPPSLGKERIAPVNALFNEMENMSAKELERLLEIIRAIRQQTSKRTNWIITSHRIVMNAKDVTTEDVLKNKHVHRRIWTRISAIASPLPTEPIPTGSMFVFIATVFRPIPRVDILIELEAHGMGLATILHLAALINSGASIIGPHPIIAFGNLRFGRRWLDTHFLPYSVRRNREGGLTYEVHKPDFWVRGKERPSPIQLLLVPKST